MRRNIKVRNVVIGEGIPKVCVPLVGETYRQIIDRASGLQNVQKDMIEWRADWFGDIFSIGKVMEVLVELFEILPECPILFTFRTETEGGRQRIDDRKYAELLQEIATTRLVDMIDIEALRCPEDLLKETIEIAHQNGIVVIGSTHDFEKTPPKEIMLKKMRCLQELSVDIPKLAVMPQNRRDTLELLAATLEMREQYSDRPLITMAMDADGVISRVAGEIFGSDITFGCVGVASAPGQLPSEDLYQVLAILHKSLSDKN